MKLTNEMKIGVLVVAVAAALLVLTFKVGNFNFTKKGYDLKVHFKKIDGVERNAPVRLNGLEVGIVKDIQILYEPETVMELTVWMDEKARVHEGTEAYVKNMGLLGEKYIGLTAGDETKEFLSPGSLVKGTEPVDFEHLLAKGDVIADNLKDITTNVNERLRLNSAYLDEIVLNLNSTSKNLDELSGDLKTNPWKLLYREKPKKTAAKDKDQVPQKD